MDPMKRSSIRIRSLLRWVVTPILLLEAGAASAFSSGAPVCTTDAVTMSLQHGPTIGVSGTYSVQVRRSGIPVTSVLAGETVQVVIGSPQNTAFKGFTLRAQLGSTSGAGVAGLAPSSGQQTMGCTPSNSGLTHTSNIPVTSRTANWTVPNALAPGQQVVFSALVTESLTGWVQVSPLTITLAAPPAVPSLGLVSMVATGAGLVGLAAWRLRRA